MIAEVEKLDGNINAHISITGPKIGKKDCLKGVIYLYNEQDYEPTRQTVIALPIQMAEK